MDRAYSTYDREDIRTVFSGGNLKERHHLEDLSVDGRIILEWVWKVWDGSVWTESICLRIWTSDRIL
jgi:hypothetical protein